MRKRRIQEEFLDFLKLEKGLSPASVQAYQYDLKKLEDFLDLQEGERGLLETELSDLQALLLYLNELGLGVNSQARLVSSLKAFFKFLILEERIEQDPALLLAAPKPQRHLPAVLTHDELAALIAAIDHSTAHGLRNRAMLEVLYACGLRVSELTGLRLSNLHLEAGFIRVIGKGNKERIIPIGEEAIKHLGYYLDLRKQQTNIDPEHTDVVFLNRRGKQITRNMVFMIIKELVKIADLQKNVSPHTFRHTFATHLVEGGANLRVVQDLLGHRSIVTTEIYTHLDLSYLQETVQTFHPRNSRS